MPIVEGWNGRFLEDFEVGDVYRNPLGRTITEADNVWFTLLTMNTNQNHFNAEYAKRSPFGRPIVNSGFTIALVLGQSVPDVSQNALANLSMEIELKHPVWVGDTIYTESLVKATRESSSRPYAGIVSVLSRGLNQDGKVCVQFARNVMVYKRDAPQVADHFPVAETSIEDAGR